MPIEYREFIYDYMIETVTLVEWLRTKDDDGWEFIAFCPKDFSGLAWNHIVQCIFRKKI